MKKLFNFVIIFISFNLCYPTNRDYYVLFTGGESNGFFQSEKTKNKLSEKGFGGIGGQFSCYRSTLVEIIGLYHPPVSVVDHPGFKQVSPSFSGEATIKQPFLSVKMQDNLKLCVYGKGGLWGGGSWVQYSWDKQSNMVSYYGVLMGVGAQSKLSSRGLVDLSINGLFSFAEGIDHTWYVRLGVGWRL